MTDNALSSDYFYKKDDWTWDEREEYIKQLKGDKPPLLFCDDVIKEINNELSKKIIGEEDLRIVLIMLMLGGTRCANVSSTSINLGVNDESGAGKDYIIKSVSDLIPKGMVFAFARITEKVLNYYKPHNRFPDFSWDEKVLVLEDAESKILNSSVMKTFLSGNRGKLNNYLVLNKNLFAEELQTMGKPVVIFSFAKPTLKEENIRRIPTVRLNLTETQTKEIVRRKLKIACTGNQSEYDYDETITDALRELKIVKVHIPFADKLESAIPTSDIGVRTHTDRIVDGIKFSATINQYNRKKTKEGRVIANEQDYYYGSLYMNKTTSNERLITFSKNAELLLNLFKSKKDESGYLWISIPEIKSEITWVSSSASYYRDLNFLKSKGFLNSITETTEGNRVVTKYQYNDIKPFSLPSWDELNSKISKTNKITKISKISKTSGVILPISPILPNSRASQQHNFNWHQQCSVCNQPKLCTEINNKPVCKECTSLTAIKMEDLYDE